jgi:hypothetical protein
MIRGQRLILYFHRDDTQRHKVPLTHFTIAAAKRAIREILSITNGAYTKADIYQGKQLIETGRKLLRPLRFYLSQSTLPAATLISEEAWSQAPANFSLKVRIAG